jgi:hypothetical protein
MRCLPQREGRQDTLSAPEILRTHHPKLCEITRELVTIELRLALLQQYATEHAKFEKLLDRNTHAQQAVEALKPRALRGDTDTLEDARQQLTDSMQQWIRTPRHPSRDHVGQSRAWRARGYCRNPR